MRVCHLMTYQMAITHMHKTLLHVKCNAIKNNFQKKEKQKKKKIR